MIASAAMTSPAAAQQPDNSRALHWRQIGPTRGGRAHALAGVPSQPNVFYIGFDNGGVWRSTDYGSTWQPIFDDQPTGSIGAIAVAPSDPNVIYVGSGAGIIRPDLAVGDGVYKSVDGGRSWTNVGLKASEHIGKILIDPTNSNIVYVAAQGPLSTKGGERGLYKTEDGGTTWTKILDGGAWAGASDVVMDPRNHNVLLASSWQRYRRTYGYIAGGPESALWRSTDGGKTWKKSQTGLPTNEDLGRIGLAISPKDPDVILLYEIYDDRAAFDAHKKTRHFLAFDKESAPLVANKVVKEFDLVCEGSAA